MTEPKAGPGLPEGAASKGGVERAKALSDEQKTEIARRGAEARWGGANLPKATHEGPLNIGGNEFDCAVLEDGTRLLSERAVTRALGGKRGGAHWRRKKAGADGANMPVYLSAENLRPFVPADLATALKSPILYRTKSGLQAFGMRAELLPRVCEVLLRARETPKALHPKQVHLAAQAEILLRGFAHVGIIALVDEATGYQYERQRDALEQYLAEFLSEELRRWVRTFPVSYFRELCRLKNVQYYPDMKLPQYFGHLTNNIVYDRLAPTLRKELEKRNPRDEAGRRKHKHHQWLSVDVGNPKLLEHLGAVVALMKISEDWETFMQRLDKVAPIYKPAPLYDGLKGAED